MKNSKLQMGLISCLLINLIFSYSFSQDIPDFAWAKQFKFNVNNSTYTRVNSTVDKDGYIYSLFRISPPTFNIDGVQTNPTTHPDAYVKSFGFMAKQETNGEVIWTIPMTNIYFLVETSLLVDEQGDIYFYGYYKNDMQAAAYFGDTLLTDPNQSSPSSETWFLIKLNNQGELIWLNKITTGYLPSSYLHSLPHHLSPYLTFDFNNNIQVLGSFKSYISFKENDTLLTNDIDNMGVYQAKYSSLGEVLEYKKLEGNEYEYSKARAEIFQTDALGNIFRFSSRYPPSTLPVLYQYTSDGELIDSLLIPMSSTSMYDYYLESIAVNSTGDIYLGGCYFGDLTLDGIVYPNFGGGVQAKDAVFFKLSAPQYNVDWVKTISTTNNDGIDILITDDLDNLYILGQRTGLNGAVRRLILQKYTSDGDLLWDLPIANSAPYSIITPHSAVQTHNGGNILISGQFQDYADFGPGYTFTTTTSQRFDAFQAQYGVCNTTNPLIDIPLTTQLCGNQDSITLSAVLDNSLNGDYYWSTPNGLIAVNNSSFAELNVGQVGKYSLILKEDEECYGKSQEIWITRSSFPDTSVTVNNNILTATETAQGTTYQWIDCQSGNLPISGAVNSTFEPTENGEYAVILTNSNGCSDTSACHVISTLDVKNNPLLDRQITLYPNPTSDNITIQTDLEIKNSIVLDLQGKKLLESTSKQVDLSKLSSGIYLIKVELSNNENWTSKVIKE